MPVVGRAGAGGGSGTGEKIRCVCLAGAAQRQVLAVVVGLLCRGRIPFQGLVDDRPFYTKVRR